MRINSRGMILAFTGLSLGACTTSSLNGIGAAPTPQDAIIAQMKGGLIGGDIGRGLSERDRRRALEAEYRTLEYTQPGTAVTWKSEDTRLAGEVVAAQPYRVGSQNCRQYSHSIGDGVNQTEARGTACRNPDGSWTPLT